MIDPQKEALYAEKTRRAGLYAQMFLLQRSGAPIDQVDAIIVAIGTAESEIARMADEVNDTVWYRNYGRVLDGYGQAVELLKIQGETRERENRDNKELLEDNSTAIKKLLTAVVEVTDRVDTLEERADQTAAREQIRDKRIAEHETVITQTSTDVATLRSEVRLRFEEIERDIAALTAHQDLLRKWLDAHPQPDALKKKPDAKR